MNPTHSIDPHLLRIGKLASRTTTAALLIMAISLAPVFFSFVYSQTSSTKNAHTTNSFTLNHKAVDIHSLIETVSLRTGKNFIVDPRVKATVTLISSNPIDAEKLYKIFLSVLEVHGYTTVPAGDFIKIVPVAVGTQSAIPALREQTTSGDTLVTEVLNVDIPAQQLVNVLKPLASQTASITAEPNTNTIIITDHADHVARLIEIIRAITAVR